MNKLMHFRNKSEESKGVNFIFKSNIKNKEGLKHMSSQMGLINSKSYDNFETKHNKENNTMSKKNSDVSILSKVYCNKSKYAQVKIDIPKSNAYMNKYKEIKKSKIDKINKKEEPIKYNNINLKFSKKTDSKDNNYTIKYPLNIFNQMTKSTFLKNYINAKKIIKKRSLSNITTNSCDRTIEKISDIEDFRTNNGLYKSNQVKLATATATINLNESISKRNKNQSSNKIININDNRYSIKSNKNFKNKIIKSLSPIKKYISKKKNSHSINTVKSYTQTTTDFSDNKKLKTIDQIQTDVEYSRILIEDNNLIDINKKTNDFMILNDFKRVNTINSEDSILSGDEKPYILNVPVFSSKRFRDFSSFNDNIINKQMINEIFYSLIKFNKSAKNKILSYLTFYDCINLSLTSKVINKEIQEKLSNFIGNLIITQNNTLIRLKIWKSIYRSSTIDINHLKEQYYQNLYGLSKYDDYIKRDLNRTIIDDSTFKVGKKNYIKLYNVLRAYSNYNNSIGYAQGLNFIVASAIIILQEEEEVFIFIDSLINKFNFTSLIGLNNGLQNRLEEIGKLMNKYVPLLTIHLEANYLNHEFFTASWIITLFSNTLKFHNLFKIWDIFLIYGWKFLNYYIISVLVTFQNDIINYDINTLSSSIKSLLKSDSFDQSFTHTVIYAFELLNSL